MASVLDTYGVRREEGPNGETVVAVAADGFAIDGHHDQRYTQDAKGVWLDEEGTKAPKDWQKALTDWATPTAPPVPAEPEHPEGVVIPDDVDPAEVDSRGNRIESDTASN